MGNEKLKVGDAIKIINCSMIEPYELNKVGTIVNIESHNEEWINYVVDMGRPRRPDIEGDNETCWWLREEHIELVNKPNEQLLFDFMYE